MYLWLCVCAFACVSVCVCLCDCLDFLPLPSLPKDGGPNSRSSYCVHFPAFPSGMGMGGGIGNPVPE